VTVPESFAGKDDRFVPSAKKACRRLSSKISQLAEGSFGCIIAPQYNPLDIGRG
jgi:hypothetical protein